MRFVHDAFRERARSLPAATAVVDGTGALTYAALLAQAEALAAVLHEHAGPGDRVAGLRLRRDRGIAIAIVGAFLAGLGVVPIDPEHPERRQAFMLRDSGARLVLSNRGAKPGETLLATVGELAVLRRDDHLPVALPPDLAYVFYTSGSTGQPKGCLVGHSHVSAFLTAMAALCATGPADVSIFHSLTFDPAVWELWSALGYGGSVVIASEHESRDTEALIDLLRRSGATVVIQTPSSFRHFLAALDRTTTFPALKWLMLGGEAIRPADVLAWWKIGAAPQAGVINQYGATETTVFTTIAIMTPELCAGDARATPIGYPLAGLDVTVRDEHGAVVPDGTQGELWTGGPTVCHGYIERPELTRERFGRDEQRGGRRYYRTGDYGYRAADGMLYFVGRRDDQVKIRAHRIELGEVEAALCAIGGVAEAACGLEERHGNPILVAYIVEQPGATVADRAVRAHMHEQLPREMRPSRLKFVPALPLNPNGKLDRRALPGAPVARSCG